MTEQLKIKLQQLVELLKKNNNGSFVFFEKIIRKMDEGDQEYIELILGSITIIQYGNFSHKEEELFREIWYITNNIKNKLSQ